MSDLVLRTATAAQVSLRSAASSVGRIVRRSAEDERGQDTIEYLGVLIVVAAVIVMVATVIPGLSGTVKTGVTNLINGVFGSGGGGGGGGH